ncbi:hypothetical protein BDA96_01G515500 [Sorghum bicolor]|uniref:Uncharacterized protein n=1 Tax=Sorghum bicolor TaxID=4558 RepID=A0A921V2I0_SORBI|nr:hypothetical protein BDA96_01G515500 [Sorghum bicolor]
MLACRWALATCQHFIAASSNHQSIKRQLSKLKTLIIWSYSHSLILVILPLPIFALYMIEQAYQNSRIAPLNGIKEIKNPNSYVYTYSIFTSKDWSYCFSHKRKSTQKR